MAGYALLKTGDTKVIKANDADSRIVIDCLQYDVSAGSFAFSGNTYPLSTFGEFCDIPCDKGADLTLTCTTGTIFVRYRQEKV